MNADAGRWICIDGGGPLQRVDLDGARCGNATHWHPRTPRGFACARPTPSVRYTDLPPAEPTPIAAGGTEHET